MKKTISILVTLTLLLGLSNVQVIMANNLFFESSELSEDSEYDNSKNKNSDNTVSLFAYSTAYPNTHTNTGNQATDIANIAKTQVGYAETSNHTKYNQWFYGSDTAAAWCAIFISWCANQADISTSTIAKNARASGYSTSNMHSNPYGCSAVAFGNRSPQIGDIIFVDNNSDNVSNHVGLVVDVDGTYIYTVEGNYSDKVSSVKYNKGNGYRNGSSSTKIVFYAVPNYADNSQPQYYNPEGYIDICEGEENSIHIRGWAFDMDASSSTVAINAYIGGDAGNSNAEGHEVYANTYRPDVNSIYGVGDYHGFDFVIPTNKIGKQEVYIYALNIEDGNNTLLGICTVEITTEKTPPVISDIQITDITEDGYTISCKVSDASGINQVTFATWTDYMGQDDILWEVGNIVGHTATYRVKTTDHNGERALYATHIYAYDIYENISIKAAPFTFVPINAIPFKELIVNNKKYILYENENKLMWHEAKIYCEQQGGHLATLSTQSEYNTIKNMMQGTDFTQTFLGATDEENEGVWKWITRESWSYTNWNTNEPNNCDGNENYLALNNSGLDFTWNDIANFCEYDSAFICEIDLPHTETSVVNYGTYKLCEPEVFNMPEQYSIVVAAYKNNKLISCETRNSSDTNPYVLLGDIDKVKVLVWKDLKSLNPLCDSEEVTSNNFIKG